MRGRKTTPNKSLKLLNNARGQLDAVIRLIHDDAAYVDILKQILATISLLRRSHTEILKKYLEECLDENGRWLFIHPYFDDVLGNRVLDASVSAGNCGIELRFRSIGSLDSAVKERIDRHMKALDIEASMIDEVLHEVLLVLSQHKHALDNLNDFETAKHSIAECASQILNKRPNDPIGLALNAVASGDLASLLRALPT